METAIQKRIIDLLTPVAQGVQVTDVRIGLGYTCVQLDNGQAGLAWTAKSHAGSCSHLPTAGTLAGQPAPALLSLLGGLGQSLAKSVGLATANALAAGLERPTATSTEILELIDVQPEEHVAMVGFFGPVVPRLKKIGCRLDIIELDAKKGGTLTPEEGEASLSTCDVAIITATSLVTGTMDGLLSGLGNPRAALLLGPSTFMRPEVYAGTKVTHLAGSWVREPGPVAQIVSEGGGTKILKKHLDFATIII
jgi:hypothetical protein